MGCLIGIAVMANVVMLNFSYDVPVKIFSSLLLLLLLYIISPFIKKLYQFLFLNQPVALQNNPLELPKRWMRISRLAIKTIFIGGIFLITAFQELGNTNYEAKDNASIDGRYKVTSFETNNEQTTCMPDSVQWTKFNLLYSYVRIYTKNDSSALYALKTDTLKKQLTLTSDTDSTKSYQLSYNKISDSTLTVNGYYKNDTVTATMKIKNRMDYSLINRGFHWINETPPNW